MTTRELDAIAVSQHGLITRSQSLRLLGEARLKHWLLAGRFVPVFRGVYRFAGAPCSSRQTAHAAVLAGGTGAVLSHRSAAVLHGLHGVLSEVPEVTVPYRRCVRVEGVRAHRSKLISSRWCTAVDGIPVTTAARTLLDLSSCVGPVLLARMLDDGLRRRLLSLDELRRCHEGLTVQGRRGVSTVRALLEHRLPGCHPADSPAELSLVETLLAAELGRAVQHQVVAEGRVYLLDLAYPHERVGVEYDGFDAHRTATAVEHDRQRDVDLDLGGWTVYRFTAGTVASAVGRVGRALERARGAQGKIAG